jgi:dipeptidyl aminopeptidase/acylaminoacyl peptidase
MKRALLVSMLLLTAVTMHAEMPRLIPREVLMTPPPKAWPKISPDGKRLAYIAPDEAGVANIWVQPAEGGTATLVTHERRGIGDYDWSGDGSHILFGQDGAGDENQHIFAADFATGNVRDLTPFRGVRSQNYLVDTKHPNEILVELNLRDRKVFDVHRVNLETGAIVLEAKNPGDVNSWTTDGDFVIRAATALDTSGRTIVRVRDSATAAWRDVLVMPFERTSFMGQIAGGSVIAGFAPDGKSLYIASALHSDTARIERIDTRSGETLEVIAEHPKADAGELRPQVVLHPQTGAIQAVGFHYMTPEWRILDPKLKADFDVITKETGRFIDVISSSADGTRWIVAAESGSAPNTYYTYDRATKKLTLLFDEGEALKGYTLATPKPLLIRARDGRELVSYLTLPPGTSGRNLPLIILPHGGPWARDNFRFDPEVQFLANRGYAVLQVNYRGSTGLGIDYYNAGNGQVGTGMVDDVIDGVRWAIAEGIADPKRIVGYGGSMGAYAVLRIATQQPELLSCVVDYVGISEVRAAIEAFPPYWVAARNRWLRRIGGDILHDDAQNRRLSPLYDVAKIQRPILVGSGGNDVRARLEHAEIFVKALRAAKREVSFVVYPDEGHGFARPENNMDFYGRVEEFLAGCAGGRAEPWKKIPGSTVEVR